jgi:hypothetical protein
VEPRQEGAMVNAQQQIAVKPRAKVDPPLTREGVSALSADEQKLYMKGKLDGYMEGREMKLVVEHQRSDLLHALELILVAEEAEQAREIARNTIDRVRAEMDKVLGR